MLSAEAYSFRQKSHLAVSLAWIAGYTNIVMLLVAGHVVSHMTGNTTVLSSGLGSGDWDKVQKYGSIVGSFFLGAAVASLMTEGARRRGWRSKFVLPIAAEMILLAVLAIWMFHLPVTNATPPGILFASIAAFTMGLQNATVTHISGGEVRTTHVSGMITDLGLEGVQFLFWWKDKLRFAQNPTRLGRALRVARRHPTFLRLLLLMSILISFGIGVVGGQIVLHHFARLVMIPPVAFLMWIIYLDWRTPMADVRELDLLRDPDLKLKDVLKIMLPAKVAIYRIAQHHASSRPPHLRAWAERISRQRRIIILALSPMMLLTENAALDLIATTEQLHKQKRILILTNFSEKQFQVIRQHGGIDTIGPENFAPDLEFAIARAVALLREQPLDDPGGRH